MPLWNPIQAYTALRKKARIFKPIRGLGWKNVILCGFGKGAGIALYASLMKIIPQQASRFRCQG